MAPFHRCLEVIAAFSIAAMTSPSRGAELTPDVYGYVHAVGVAMDQSSVDALDPATGDPLNETRFLVRRARLGVRLILPVGFAGVEIDGNTADGPEVGLVKAFVGIATAEGEQPDAWSLFEARLGLMATPFGAELQTTSRERPFLERSTAAGALFPGTFDLGIAVRGQWRFVRYQVALMNGSPLGSADFAGQDPSSGKDLMGRLGVALSITDHVALEAGGSMLAGEGFSPGVPSTKDSVQWRDANENGVVELSELTPISGTTGRPSEAFDRSALGLDAQLRIDIPSLGSMTLSGELYWAGNLERSESTADPVTLGRDLRELGWWAALSQDISGHGRLAVRYDSYDPDADASEQIAARLVPLDRSRSTISAAAAWISYSPFELTVQFDHEDNTLGRAADGTPTRFEDDRLMVWAQVGL